MRLGRVSARFYTSRLLKKSLEFAANNGALFTAGTSLILSSTVRPLVILSTPKTDKENKRLACAKSVASALTGYFLMLFASRPVAKSVEKIDGKPQKYLKNSALKAYKITNESSKSKSYKFATQLFKLGTGFLLAIPKSVIVCALTPIMLAGFFKPQDKSKLENIPFKGKNISFSSKNSLTEHIAGILNKKRFQKFAEKYKDTNFAMHITALTDALTTLTFVRQTSKSQKISPERKSPLIYNSLIATGLSIVGGYLVDRLLDKPAEKFIEKFKNLNREDAKLDKYIEGIKIAKPVIILGVIYYTLIPFISTFLADRAPNKNKM